MSKHVRLKPGCVVSFAYTNHKGVDSVRLVTYSSMDFMECDGYYPTPGFYLTGWCHKRKAVRSFRVDFIRNIDVEFSP